MIITARPLTAEAFAAFGGVIEGREGGGRVVNEGSAQRFDRVADLENRRSGSARLDISVFRSKPRGDFPLEVAVMEKHPHSSQAFVPMSVDRFLVVVALGDDAPDERTIQAFVAARSQGMAYHPGVWHHSLIVLDREADFACFVWEDGSAGDCTVFEIPPPRRVCVVLP